MKLAVHCANLTWPGGPAALGQTLAEVAQVADEGGVTTLTMMDHYFQMEQLGGPPEPMLEGYTSLGFLAGKTSNVELGLLVTGVTYRHPGLLAKIATTLDVLSGGRAMLGIGAAWYEREHAGLGVPFPSTCRAVRAARGGAADLSPDVERRRRPLHGQALPAGRDRLRPAAAPAPAARRLLIGGSGERKTLRLVAKYADACNLFGVEPAEVAHKIEVLDRHCETEGRDPAQVQRTLISGTDPLEDIDAFLRRCEEYAALGIDQVWVGPNADDPVGSVTRICEDVLPDSGRSARDPARPADGPGHRGDGRARTRPRPSVRRPRHPRRRARTIHRPGSASW